MLDQLRRLRHSSFVPESYYRVRLLNVPSSLEDLVTQICFDHQASGLSEALAYNQTDLVYDPVILSSDLHALDIYFSQKPSSSFIEALKKHLPQLQHEIHQEEHKDWLEEWKKGFEPFKLVGPYWIVPSWHKAPEQALKPIMIDPGMAFGTGTHATTQMMAFLLHQEIKNIKTPNSYQLLDVGAGTAILSILASFSGVHFIVGSEIDPEARRVAQENLHLNHVDNILIVDENIDSLKESFDCVIANIIDGVLIKIKNSLIAKLKPSGSLLLSGILLEREEYFLDQFLTNTTLQVTHRIEKDEWVAFKLKFS